MLNYNKLLVIAFGLFTLTVTVTRATFGPIHASCSLEWNFSINCSTVNIALINQIKHWSGNDCKTGEKCLYTLKQYSKLEIKATHKTPVHKYVDDLTFKFTAKDAGCKVQGHSSSETWYAILDYGTNYCNLHNLLTGAKLNKSPHFQEKTSNKICTQYSSANCTKY